MNDRNASQDQPPKNPAPRYEILERVTAIVLGLVAATLLWILLAGSQIRWLRLGVVEWEVALVLALFTAALVLVSVLALLESRG